jgi:gluconate kinase
VRAEDPRDRHVRAEERDLILSQFAEVEPLLRGTCTHEIDATQPIEEVVADLVAIGEEPASAA